MSTDDPFEDTKEKIDRNLKKIEGLSIIWKNEQKDPELWFKAWALIKDTTALIEELELEYNRLKARQLN